MGELVVQKLMKEVKTEIEMGIKYYSILSALNSLDLSERQLQLLAFTAVRGTITPKPAREEFIKMFGSSKNSLENIKGVLVHMGLLVKIGGMHRVLPSIDLDFSKDMIFQINLKNKENRNEGK